MKIIQSKTRRLSEDAFDINLVIPDGEVSLGVCTREDTLSIAHDLLVAASVLAYRMGESELEGKIDDVLDTMFKEKLVKTGT